MSLEKRLAEVYRCICNDCGSSGPEMLSAKGASESANAAGWVLLAGRDLCAACKAKVYEKLSDIVRRT